MIHKIKFTSNFSSNPNEIFDDNRVSRKAKCLLLELLSKPASWNLNFSHLINSGKEGEHSIRAGINELIDVGYIHRDTQRENGKLGKTEYHIFYQPITKGEFQGLLDADKPAMGKKAMGKTAMREKAMGKTATIINKELTNTDLINTEGNNDYNDELGKPKPDQVEQPKSSSSLTSPDVENETIVSPPIAGALKKDIPKEVAELIPARYKATPVIDLVNRALLDHTEQEIKDSIAYAANYVKGGTWQFKAYLDKTIKGNWAAGFMDAGPGRGIKTSDNITCFFAGETLLPALGSPGGFSGHGMGGRARYANGTITGSKRMDSNYQAAAVFMASMKADIAAGKGVTF